MIIRRMPMTVLQTAVYSILQHQTTPVYDDVPKDAAMPCITFGPFTCKQVGNKGTDINDISQQLYIWSEYEGKKELNEIANDVYAVLTSYPLELANGFIALSQDVDFFEAFAEEDSGYHGVITFVAKIQNIGE
ncbi:MAG: DUF3168 domain-containing protein [Acidaminococcaceae bacterium]